MGNHKQTVLDRARDELFSHIQRCAVLQATEEHQKEWLEETMEFMAERYPDLTKLQMAQLEAMGRRYIQPAIPHGRGTNETNREDWIEDEAEEAVEEVSEVDEEIPQVDEEIPQAEEGAPQVA
ncbi:MAG: hypothetical protein R3223_00055 [Longimicrobiales bacterium]|nr:hypothetical protein [Longimicrobiales bacterium]